MEDLEACNSQQQEEHGVSVYRKSIPSPAETVVTASLSLESSHSETSDCSAPPVSPVVVRRRRRLSIQPQQQEEDEEEEISPLPSISVDYSSQEDNHSMNSTDQKHLVSENERLLKQVRLLEEECQELRAKLGITQQQQQQHKTEMFRGRDEETDEEEDPLSTSPSPPPPPTEKKSPSSSSPWGWIRSFSPIDSAANTFAGGLHHRRHKVPPSSGGGNTASRQLFGQAEDFQALLEEGSALAGGGEETQRSNEDDDDDDDKSTGAAPGMSSSGRGSSTAGFGELEQPFWEAVWDRSGWLVGLLVLQSLSSFIISRNEMLLQKHLVIVQFLTMLVGAGGNAGNQSSVRVVRGLALGTIHDGNAWQFLKNEVRMGVTLATILGVAGCVRAAVFLVPVAETIAITISLYSIVWISIFLGALLPLAMKYGGIDPANSSTTIQVIMDILGVTITVHVASIILDSNFAAWLTGTSLT